MKKDNIQKPNPNNSVSKNHYEPNESIHDYDSDESPDDYDRSKWDSNLEVRYSINFSHQSKKEVVRMKVILEDNGFVTSVPFKDHKIYHCTAKRKILVKEWVIMDKLVNELFLDSPASVGYSQIDKFANENEKLGLLFS